MKLSWLIAAAAIALVIMCSVRYSQDWLARQDQPDQFQWAAEMMRDYPTAAGKK